MKRIDIRVYVDDDHACVSRQDLEEIGESLTGIATDVLNLATEDHCPKGIFTVLYQIEDDVDYPNELYM